MPRDIATVFARLRRLVRRLTRVEVVRPKADRASAATDPEMLKNIPSGGGVDQ